MNCTKSIFTPANLFQRGRFLVPRAEFRQLNQLAGNKACPIVFDTEFVPGGYSAMKDPTPYSVESPPTRKLTAQFGSPGITEKFMGVESDLPNPHRGDVVMKGPFYPVDWMKSLGYNVTMRREEGIHEKPDGRIDTRMPSMLFVMYAHFMVVDFFKIFGGDDCAPYVIDIKEAVAKKRIVQGRRLTTASERGIIRFDWVIQIDGQDHRVEFKFVDTAGLHGIAGYGDIAKTVGHELPYKDLMGDRIENMEAAYYEVPKDFRLYALGDLDVFDLLEKYDQKLRAMYGDLGIAEYYDTHRSLKLTIGATVAQMILAAIAKTFDLDPEEISTAGDAEKFLQGVTSESSAATLAKGAFNDTLFLGKCDGGRCYLWNTTNVQMFGALCDIDLKGAYASMMSNLPMIFGVPTVVEGKGRTLREMRKALRGQLVDRTWYARVSTRQGYLHTFEQDLIPSWNGIKYTEGKIDWKADSQSFENTGEIDLSAGTTRIFTREIKRGTITSDIFDWMETALTKRQRDDLLDNLIVESIAYYPKRYRCDTVEEFNTKRAEWFTADGRDCPYWFTENIGQMLVDKIRALRNKYPKKTHPAENALAKLFGNVVYGTSVSRFFMTSNIVTASQITAGVRVMMWATEKSLNLNGSITDGQIFDMNKVNHPTEGRRCGKRKQQNTMGSENIVGLYKHGPKTRSRKRLPRTGPLGGHEITIKANRRLNPKKHDRGCITLTRANGERYTGNAAYEWIDRAALEHVKACYPELKVLSERSQLLNYSTDGSVGYRDGEGIFTFETKRVGVEADTHGSADYCMHSIGNVGTKKEKRMADGALREIDVPYYKGDLWVYAIRSYEAKKRHQAFDLDANGNFIWLDTYQDISPGMAMMQAISNDPDRVPLQIPFAKPGILKCGGYRASRIYEQSGLLPGDTIYRLGMARLFSLSAFTYQSYDQMVHWERAHNKVKRQLGVSFECFFLNDDDTVRYREMIQTLDDMITSGVNNPLTVLDSSEHGKAATRAKLIERGHGFAPTRYQTALNALRSQIRAKIHDPRFDAFNAGFIDFGDGGDGPNEFEVYV